VSSKKENKHTGLARVACSVGVFLVLVRVPLGYSNFLRQRQREERTVAETLPVCAHHCWGRPKLRLRKGSGKLAGGQVWVFFKQLGRTFLFAILAVGCCAVCAGFANAFNPTSALFMYLAALVFVTLAIHSTTKLVEGPGGASECDVADAQKSAG
jgi:hypothetical protein